MMLLPLTAFILSFFAGDTLDTDSQKPLVKKEEKSAIKLCEKGNEYGDRPVGALFGHTLAVHLDRTKSSL